MGLIKNAGVLITKKICFQRTITEYIGLEIQQGEDVRGTRTSYINGGNKMKFRD